MDILKKIYDEKLSSDDAIDLIDDARVLYNKGKEARKLWLQGYRYLYNKRHAQYL